MCNREAINDFIDFLREADGQYDKEALIKAAQHRYGLTQDRSVFSCDDYSVRFCKSARKNLSNTVLCLSALQKYDGKPFIVCIVTADKNYLLLANTTFYRRYVLLLTNNFYMVLLYCFIGLAVIQEE